MRVATHCPHRAAYQRILLLGPLLGLLAAPVAAIAEEESLPDDRQSLETPDKKPNESEGFELPSSSDAQPSADAPEGDPLAGWRAEDPRLARREGRMVLVASTFGFAGAFGGMSVWALFTSSTFQDEGAKRGWRTASLVLAGMAAIGLGIGTVLWATAPKAPPATGPATTPGLALNVMAGPGGVSARLQLRFF